MKYKVVVKTYGYAALVVEASSKEEAVAKAIDNPNGWGEDGLDWRHWDIHKKPEYKKGDEEIEDVYHENDENFSPTNLI